MYGSISAGAESDIQQLTGIARQMVGRWGMSPEIGPIAVIPSDAQGPLLPGVSEVSEATQELIDREVRRIVDEAYQAVTRLLTEHRDKLDSLTERLLELETLDMDEAYAAAGVPVPRARLAEEPSSPSPERRGRAGRRSARARAARGPRRAARRPATGSRATSASGGSRAAAPPSRSRSRPRPRAPARRRVTSSPKWCAISSRSGRPAPLSGETTYIASWPSSELSAASRSACARS